MDDIAFWFCKLIGWAYNIAARLNPEMATWAIESMAGELRVDKTQQHYREAVGAK